MHALVLLRRGTCPSSRSLRIQVVPRIRGNRRPRSRAWTHLRVGVVTSVRFRMGEKSAMGCAAGEARSSQLSTSPRIAWKCSSESGFCPPEVKLLPMEFPGASRSKLPMPCRYRGGRTRSRATRTRLSELVHGLILTVPWRKPQDESYSMLNDLRVDHARGGSRVSFAPRFSTRRVSGLGPETGKRGNSPTTSLRFPPLATQSPPSANAL